MRKKQLKELYILNGNQNSGKAIPQYKFTLKLKNK